jgi:hypothetical protein
MSNEKSQWPEVNDKKPDLCENKIFLYGIPKIGKTTFFSNFPDALFFLTEEGALHVPVRGYSIKNWADFIVRLNELEEGVKAGQCPFKTVVIDTADELTAMCDEFICQKQGIQLLGDEGYGKGFSRYSKAFRKEIRRLVKLGLGVAFTSHAAEKEVRIESITNPYAPTSGDLQTGNVRMVVPTLERRAYVFLSGMADMILYAEIDRDNKRVIRTKPSKHFEAGDRSGLLPETISLDYGKFVNAYYEENGDGTATAKIIERINLAEQYLAEHKIDGFDTPKRAENSRKKHLETTTEKASLVKLEGYLQHLRLKAKNHKREEKKNGKVS